MDKGLDKRLNKGLDKLCEILKSYGSVAVAFSGGVDSTLLLKVAYMTLGDKCIAITAIMPSFPKRERTEAADFIKSLGVKNVTFETNELSDENYVKNDKLRCYYCKRLFFSQMKKIAEGNGANVLCEGTNIDDLSDYRPGLRAIEELDIKSPLKEANLSKADIRELSRQLNLKTSEKSAFACLATRIPYHETITREKLAMVEAAEDVMKDAGFGQYRVRYYGKLAKIEVLSEDIDKVVEQKEQLIKGIRSAGFEQVAVDLSGYGR